MIPLGCLSAPLLSFFWYVFENGFKTGHLDDPLELLKEKHHTEQGQMNKGGRSCTATFSRPGSARCSRSWHQIHYRVKESAIFLPQLSLLLAQWTKQTLQNLFVDLLIDRLAMWQDFTVDGAHTSHSTTSSISFQTNLLCACKSNRNYIFF